jgi:IS605 OrfB family transposase
MQLVEQHIIKKNDSRFQPLDTAAFASKNLYNAANYVLRQEFIKEGRYISYRKLQKQMQPMEAYKALPAKVAQQVLINLDKNWQSFFAATGEWKKNPTKFNAKPKLPNYKDKLSGRNLLLYTSQALSRKQVKQGKIKPSGLDIVVQTKQSKVDCVRIVPKKIHYVVEVVYTVQPKPASVLSSLVAGIDIGLNNLATVTSNKQGFVPLVVNGRPLKSINQYYNKQRAYLQSQTKEKTSHRIEQLNFKRNQKVNHELHVASRFIVNHLQKEGIGNLVIGKNPNWKQKINIGDQNNQNFVSIPHARFISMLTYKAQLVSIKVVITEESYTSKCSFLDLEPIEKREVYLGKRISRGMFRSSKGFLINADVNGSYNIIRKVAPNAFSNGVEGVVVHPLRVSLKNEPME